MAAPPAKDVLVRDDPRPGVRRLTMNRPEKRNALNNELRGAILAALTEADADPAVKVSILRGAGPSFSSGYDLGANNAADQPYYHGGRGRAVGAPRRRRLVSHLGSRQTGHRPGARLLPGRRQRAR